MTLMEGIGREGDDNRREEDGVDDMRGRRDSKQ